MLLSPSFQNSSALLAMFYTTLNQFFLTWGPWIDFRESVNLDGGEKLQLYFH